MDTDARRTGDTINIDGGYQHRALTSGPAMQRFWHHSKLMAISQLLPTAENDFVLDIGCGSGVISNHLAGTGASVLAIDGNEEAIAFAQRQYGSPQIEFRHGLVDEHFQVANPVDKAYCLELIEHIYYPQGRQLLGHIRTALREEGQIFLTTPNYHSTWPVIEWVMDHTGRAPQLAGDQHVEFFNPKKLREIMVDSGFEIQYLGTKCGFAPWVAPLSWSLAERLQTSELNSRRTFGSILVCVAKAL